MIFRPAMLWNAIVAFCMTVYGKLRGFRILANAEEVEERLNECEDCDRLTEERQCRDCGCFVDAKTMLAMEQCPRKKWKRIKAVKSA